MPDVVAYDTLTGRITATRDRVLGWTEDDVVASLQHAEVAADMAEAYLRERFLGREDHPDVITAILLTIALLRVQELTAMAMVECDEDHCWTTNQYRKRGRVFIEKLDDVVNHPAGALEIAYQSMPAISGWGIPQAQKGWRMPEVQQAWTRIKGAAAPLIYQQAVEGIAR